MTKCVVLLKDELHFRAPGWCDAYIRPHVTVHVQLVVVQCSLHRQMKTITPPPFPTTTNHQNKAAQLRFLNYGMKFHLVRFSLDGLSYSGVFIGESKNMRGDSFKHYNYLYDIKRLKIELKKAFFFLSAEFMNPQTVMNPQNKTF